MRTLLIVFCIAIAVLIGIQANPLLSLQQELRGSIQLTVKDKQTGKGIPGAEVLLLPSNRGATDAEGRFVFSDLPMSAYSLRIQRPGYVPAVANNLGQVATAAVAVDVQLPNPTVVVEMTQGRTLAGRLRGIDGKPIAGITVVPMRLAYQAGLPSLTRVFIGADPVFPKPITMTNDQGEYLLPGLSPGEYYLRAEHRPSATPAGAGMARMSYFPGTADSGAAAPIVIPEGVDMTGVDFMIPTVPNVKVSGKVVINVPGGCGVPAGSQLPTIATFFLVTRNTAALDRESSIVANAADPKGATADFVPFELRNMPPGSWDLYPVCAGPNNGPFYTSRTPIEIKDRDLENLTISVRPYIALTGKIIRKDAASSVPLERLGVQMQLRDPIPSSLGSRGLGAAARGQRPQVDLEGVFTVPDLTQAQYSVSVTGLPAGIYLERVRLGPVTSDSGIVRVDDAAAAAELELTISPGATTVQGVVWDRAKRPFNLASVVLVPQQARRENPLFYKRVRSGSDGRFTFTEVAPGDYKIYAWQTAPVGRAEENPQFLARYEQSGKPLTVRPGVVPADIQVDLIADVR